MVTLSGCRLFGPVADGELWPDQMQAWFARFTADIEFACRAGPFDQAAPALLPTVLAGDLPPAGQQAVTGPVGQRPPPRLAPRAWRHPVTGLPRAELTWAPFPA